MKLSNFQKNILRHSLVILVCLVVLVLCIIGITKTIKDIFELREVSAETNPPKVNLVCLEEPVVIEPETVYFDIPLSHEVQETRSLRNAKNTAFLPLLWWHRSSMKASSTDTPLVMMDGRRG